MTKAKTIASFVAVAFAASLCAQTKHMAPAFTSSLPKPPREAAPALKATIGKTFRGGYVFIDGKYIKPPYRVERYGTVMRINGIQATREVIPWNEFVKTQPGAKRTETVVQPADPEPAASAGPEPEAAPEVSLDDVSADLDDLFSDEPTTKPKKSASAPKPRRPPKPRQPVTVVSYTLEGPFVPNERTKAMVDKLNAYRTKLDGNLRSGRYYFFGSRYPVLSGDAMTGDRIVEQVYDALRTSSSSEEFAAALSNGDTSMLPAVLVEELFRHKADNLALDRRVKETKERRELNRMLNR